MPIWPTSWAFSTPSWARESRKATRRRCAPSDRPAAGIDPDCDEARKLIDYGLAELVDGEVVLNDRTMGAIVARTPDPLLYVRAILRMFESTRESIDNLAADLVHALEELYTARFGAAHVPKPEEMAELSRIVLDYRDLGNRVIANRLDEAMREQMVTAVSDVHRRDSVERAVGPEVATRG